MKLEEQFLKLYPHQTEDYLDMDEAELCAKIAEDFAIGFAEWMSKEYWLNSSGKYLFCKTTTELLEIYKQTL